MSWKWVVLGVAVVVVVVGAFTILDARFKIDGKNNTEYDCTDNASDPYCACMSTIGDEQWCGASKSDDDGEQTWGTDCTESTCVAVTTCENGTTLSCDGEFRAFADESGVRCLDTGSDPGNSIYCSN